MTEAQKLRFRKRTKIVATIGPASCSEEVLEQMILNGLDVARINFSHANYDDLELWIKRIRQLSKKHLIPVAILGDLRGPRVRVGEMENGAIELPGESVVRITPEELTGTPECISSSFPALADDVEPGSILLLDDGNLELKVLEKFGDRSFNCRVTRGGTLTSRRGINLPGRRVSLPSVTEKDKEDIAFAIRHAFDFLALSFVQTAADVLGLKEYLRSKASSIPVISKIEKKGALDDIDDIVAESYGVMVARGDLALEMSLQDVPIAQKRIIAACRHASKPVITATQMLESMTNSHKPTRAEAADVANAILDGTSAVMLSGESAIGKFPAITVETMANIARRTEAAWFDGELPPPAPLPDTDKTEETVAYAATIVARRLKAKVIIAFTTSGSTPRLISVHRPSVPILALSSNQGTRRRSILTWGTQPVRIDEVLGTAHMVHMAYSIAREHVGAQAGDIIVLVAGTPFGVAGNTNLLKVEIIPPEES